LRWSSAILRLQIQTAPKPIAKPALPIGGICRLRGERKLITFENLISIITVLFPTYVIMHKAQQLNWTFIVLGLLIIFYSGFTSAAFTVRLFGEENLCIPIFNTGIIAAGIKSVPSGV